MTSDQIAKAASDVGWDLNGDLPFTPNQTTEVAVLRWSMEVAYHLAILNEQIGEVINNRNPQIRVMVEPGDWPIQTQEQQRR